MPDIVRLAMLDPEEPLAVRLTLDTDRLARFAQRLADVPLPDMPEETPQAKPLRADVPGECIVFPPAVLGRCAHDD